MAEGFVCGRGRGSKLGPLELFVDGNVNEKLYAYGKHSSIGSKMLCASAPIGESRQSGFHADNLTLDGIATIQLVVQKIEYEDSGGGTSGRGDIFVAVYKSGDEVSSPLLSKYIYKTQYEPYIVNFSLKNLAQGEKYDFALTATPQGEHPSKNYGPTIYVSRISLLLSSRQ